MSSGWWSWTLPSNPHSTWSDPPRTGKIGDSVIQGEHVCNGLLDPCSESGSRYLKKNIKNVKITLSVFFWSLTHELFFPIHHFLTINIKKNFQTFMLGKEKTASETKSGSVKNVALRLGRGPVQEEAHAMMPLSYWKLKVDSASWQICYSSLQ